MATHATVLHLSQDDAGRRLSAEEFAAAEFAGPWKYERIDGRLVVMSPKSPEHDDALEAFRDLLVVYKCEHPRIVDKVIEESWFRTKEGNDLVPDLAVYLRSERSAHARPDRVPELILEVVSPGRRSEARDYVAKRAIYHQAGVREYVIIDRFQRTATVLTHGETDFAERRLKPSDTYTTPLLPGLEVPLTEVFKSSEVEP